MENTTQVGVGGMPTPATLTTFMNKFMLVLVMLVVVSLIAYYMFDARWLLFVFINIVTLIFLVGTVVNKHFDEDVRTSERDRVELARRPSILSALSPQVKIMFWTSLCVWFLAHVLLYLMQVKSGFFAICDVFIVAGYVLFFHYAQKMRTRKLMEDVATAFGYSFTPSGDMATLPQLFSSVGNKRDISNVCSGVWKSFPVRLFSFRFVVGSGKNTTAYTRTIFEVSTSETFPTMTISPASLFTKHEFTIENYIENLEEVHLEGDFEKSFFVQCAKGAQSEIRQVLTPDIMAYLVDSKSKHRYMCMEGKVYVIMEGADGGDASFYSVQNYVEFVEWSQTVIDKWLETLTRME